MPGTPSAQRRLAVWAALLTCLLAGCAGGEIPGVDGPVPRLEPAPDSATEAVATARLPKPWLLYNRPPELYGVPVLEPEGGTDWTVTGQWSADADALAGEQYWVLMGGIFTWYRLTANVAPWGRVHLWGQLPDDWIVGDREAVPRVEPIPGAPWHSVPFSLGHVLAPAGGTPLALHACPATDCPVLERPQTGQLVPVTGLLTDASGRSWHRVEFRQTLLWVPAGRVRIPPALLLQRPDTRGAGYRSCEPLVLFPPPPHTLCPVDGEGRFLDGSERERDRLDPVFGRLPHARFPVEPEPATD